MKSRYSLPDVAIPRLQGLWLAPLAIFLIAMLCSTAVAQACGDDCGPDSDNAIFCRLDGGYWIPASCSCRNMSPIIISLSRNGYHLTSATDGVAFDLNADGSPERIAWTSANSDDVFLALDRNGNGQIDNGKELFGNVTDQPASPHRNGFLALAVFDNPENGGNGDGIIDKRDTVYPLLRLWRDSNHNGISEPNELFTLVATAVRSISLDFSTSFRTDSNGNVFRYRARINAGTNSSVALWAYDVFLATLDSQGDRIQTRTQQGSHRFPGNLPPDIDTSWTSPAGAAGQVRGSSPTAPSGANVIAAINHSNGPARPISHQRSSLIMDRDAVPKAQIWNDSDRQITGAVITVDLGIHSDNIQKVEGLVYHDAYIDARHRAPIEGKGTMQIPIPYVKGAGAQNLAPNVRAVLYSDGSAEGEQEWVDILMKRRGRLYRRLLSIRNLLASEVDVVPISQIIEDLRSAQNELRQRLGPDELASIDDIAFGSAIATLGANSKHGANHSMKWYVALLDNRIARLAPWATAVPSETGTNLTPDSSPQHGRTERYAVSRQSLGRSGIPSFRRASLGDGLRFSRMLADTYTCSFSSQTRTVTLTNGCGPNQYYSLALNLVQHDLTTNTTSNITVTQGPDWAFGTCYAAYTDCNGNSNDSNSVTGMAESRSLSHTGQGYNEYWWNIDDWNVTSDACSCSDPYPNGNTPNLVDDDWETGHIIVYLNTACP